MDDWTESLWKVSFYPSLGWQDVDLLLPAATPMPFYPHLSWKDINGSACPECEGDGESRPESGIVWP